MLKIISQSNSGKSNTILKVYLYIQIYIYIFHGHKMIFVGEKFAIFQIIMIGRVGVAQFLVHVCACASTSCQLCHQDESSFRRNFSPRVW